MRKVIRWTIFIVLGCVALFVIWAVAMSIDREYQRTTELADGVTLVETIHVTRSAVTEIADSGGSATIPVPYRSEWVKDQKIFRNGTELWHGPSDKTFKTSVSPDHHYLVLWDDVHTEWWRIYDLSTGTSTEIYMPKHPGMGDAMVPLKFGWWSFDSTRIYVALDGTEVEPNKQWMRYRETYLLDPATGDFYKQDHCHQPTDPTLPYSRPNWDNTLCAGTYEVY